ncbi:transporter substrate-binding domain-containing protein [Thalassotalea sp. LPB0316]|uniref:substrate-binding periplasmic protein n=1 Tax=Thalassotalea sp. LPB0316 TaxID=2769490 RepID=UPI0018661C7E|nr:transporter substrate-binding domain-containing protein [Thalassotalea sp. LPB0316]QOL26308.1 transporter substrate-binding domain-containing protein [Thalassotalea sp. LPB0316]
MMNFNIVKTLEKLITCKGGWHRALNALLLVFFCSLSASATNLRIVTEDSYPVQYLENSVIKGKNAETVQAMLTGANLAAEIEVLPWARAYNIALNSPNVMIFSIARTPAREHEFIWGRPITDLSYSLYTLKENQQAFSSLSQQELKALNIAAIRNSATEQHLTKYGYENLQLVNNPVQMVNMLNKKRVDAIPANSTSLAAFCQKMSLNCDRLVEFHPLPVPSTQLYFAFSKGTDPHLISRLLQAYDESPEIDKLE